MKHIGLSLAFLALLWCTNSSAAEISRGVQLDAKKAFAKGNAFYIWISDTPPPKGGVVAFWGSGVPVTVNYFASESDLGSPFKIFTRITGTDWQQGKGATFTTTSGATKATERSGKSTSMVFAEGKKLIGKGTATIYLVALDDEKGEKAVSNVLEIEVLFPDEKK